MHINLKAFENIERSQGQDAAMYAAQCWIAEGRGEHGLESVYGLESVSAFESWEELEPPTARYVNTGETYSETIARMPDGTYELTTWGDVLETLEEQRAEEREETRCYECGSWYSNDDGPCHPGES